MTKKNRIPRILFAAPASGSGKTTIVCGLLKAWKEQGITSTSFKCGPDYIDPMFHHQVLGISGYNLDSFFLEEDQIRCLFETQCQEADLAVIEGVMGYYDGVGGNHLKASSYEIAKITDTPVVLIVDGKKSSLSMVALIKGFLEFQPDSRICGVILNRTSSVMAQRLEPQIQSLGLRLYGAIPECKEAVLESRHLGLVIPMEQRRLQEQIKALSSKLEEWVDLDGLLALARNSSEWSSIKPKQEEVIPYSKLLKGFRMGVAKDEAFCFYYQENLDFLESLGCELVFFSPIHDTSLPDGLQGLLLGGGYPELHAKELSQNITMRCQIKIAVDNGIKLLAECGGFLYLHQNLEGIDHKSYPMVGVVTANGYRTEKRSRFGYITLNGIMGSIKAHEFHYWNSTNPGTDMHAQKPMSDRSWFCIHGSNQQIIGFPHLYYLSAPKMIADFLSKEV